MHPRKIARQGQEIALPGLLDSERNGADKHPSFFFFLVPIINLLNPATISSILPSTSPPNF
jgi:hypothetical protein